LDLEIIYTQILPHLTLLRMTSPRSHLSLLRPKPFTQHRRIQPNSNKSLSYHTHRGVDSIKTERTGKKNREGSKCRTSSERKSEGERERRETKKK
jgi:hypothetical protein